MVSKLGILCLALALIILIFTNLRMFLVLCFLYYAYKFLYKKENPTKIDKIVILALIALFLLETFLMFFLINYYDLSQIYNTTLE
ncbi:MAG: hypothetical protein QXD55_00415 [Candidatus Aenigmatarchaeota archaeon]